MKRIILLASLFLCIASAHGMQKPGYTLNDPYFDSRKKEYVIEAVDAKQEKVGFVAYYPTRGTTWQMREIEVDHAHRRNRIALALLDQCIKKVKEANGSELIWQIWPKDIGMTENRLIAIYYEMLEKINPGYAAKTALEYRGDENLQSPWLILNLE